MDRSFFGPRTLRPVSRPNSRNTMIAENFIEVPAVLRTGHSVRPPAFPAHPSNGSELLWSADAPSGFAPQFSKHDDSRELYRSAGGPPDRALRASAGVPCSPIKWIGASLVRGRSVRFRAPILETR